MTARSAKLSKSDLIGLFPAAGFAKRLASSLLLHHEQHLQELPKELLPVRRMEPACYSLHTSLPSAHIPVGDYLVESYRAANITQLAIITRAEKKSLIRHYEHQRFSDLTLFPTLVESTAGTVHTINAAYEHLQGKTVAMGFPDIIVRPVNVFTELLNVLQEHDFEVVLGLFPVSATHKFDMVDFRLTPAVAATEAHQNHVGEVHSIVIKPQHTSLSYTWVCAVWKPEFTEFLHEKLINSDDSFGPTAQDSTAAASALAQSELYVGHVLQDALRQNHNVGCVVFTDGRALDIGTPDDFELARSDALAAYFSS